MGKLIVNGYLTIFSIAMLVYQRVEARPQIIDPLEIRVAIVHLPASPTLPQAGCGAATCSTLHGKGQAARAAETCLGWVGV